MEHSVGEIISKIKSKDFEGLEMLIDTYGYMIVLSIQQVLNRPEEKESIEDIQNETFYKIWGSIEKYDEEKGAFSTWVCTIARRTALDRKKKEIKQQAIEPIEEKTIEVFDDSEIVEADGFLDLISVLNEEDQLIFIKYFYFNDMPKDIAEDLALTTDIIYNRLSRGKKKIKENLQKGAIG